MVRHCIWYNQFVLAAFTNQGYLYSTNVTSTHGYNTVSYTTAVMKKTSVTFPSYIHTYMLQKYISHHQNPANTILSEFRV